MIRPLIAAVVITAGSGLAAAPVAVAGPPNKNCTAARADGASNMTRDHPGYRDELDRDQDGIACES